MWRRPADEYARERAMEAKAVADRVERSIEQHIQDCSRKTDALRDSIDRQFNDMRDNQVTRHNENVRRLDSQDRSLQRINWLMLTVAGSLITGMVALIFALIHNGGRL